MIKFSNQVPSVYSNASRDFQYLGWLIDIVLNSVKHNVDDIYNLPNSEVDPKLTELLALTLGFKVKRNYDQSQLHALIAALPRILKYKGTKTAIDMAGNALLAASGALGNDDFEFKSETSEDSSEVSKGEIRVTFPVGLIDISLFTDLLDYILPAGMVCRIVRKNEIKQEPKTKLHYEDILLANWIPDLDQWIPADPDLGQTEDLLLPGLANMFDISKPEVSFSNFGNTSNKNMPNVGLLDNSIIPGIVPREAAVSDDYTTESNNAGTTVIIGKSSTEENDAGTTVVVGG